MDIVWDFHGFRFQAHGGRTIFGGHISLQDGLHPSQSHGGGVGGRSRNARNSEIRVTLPGSGNR